MKKRPNLRLLIVGSGPLKDEINLMIDSMKLNDTITLMEFVNPLELVKLLNDAKFFLSFTSSDGTPLSLFEAMACGLYPIISNNLSNREWFNKGIIATCVNLDDLKHIVNSVESI